MAKAYGLTEEDRRGLKKLIAKMGAGKGVPSRRAVPTRRRTVGGSEDFRLIRGQSVGAQSGGTLNLDNVIVLSGGLDPSAGNPATIVPVYNLFSQSYSDNEFIQAVYSEEVTSGVDWETLKTSGTETFRLIRGLVKGDVTADDATFVIDNVIPLANGIDPVSGNPVTEVTVQNINLPSGSKEAFEDNTPITAIYDGTDWEVLLVERYRSVRGLCVGAKTTSDATFNIDNIEPLESGLDPRTDTTSTAETLTVHNINPSSYADDSNVWADYNTERNRWEARPSGSQGDTIVVKISGTITGRVGTTRGSGTAQPVNYSTLADEGGTITVYNLSINDYLGGVSGGPLYCLAFKINGDYFIDNPDLRSITNFGDNHYLGADGGEPTWRAFVTDTIDGTAECVDGVITITISPDTFVIPPS